MKNYYICGKFETLRNMKKIFTMLIVALFAALGASAQLYIVGDGDGLGWDPENPLEVLPQSDGSYQVTITNLVACKVSTAKGVWNTFNQSSIGVDGNFADQGTYNLKVGSMDNIAMPWKGDWTLNFNNTLTSVTLSTTTSKPSAYTFYLRGGMNNWGVEDEWKFEYVEGENYILRNVSIKKGEEFKVADASFGTINFGGYPNMELGVSYDFNAGGENCSLVEDFTGDVCFNLNLKRIRFGYLVKKLYVVGVFNNWDVAKDEMTRIDNTNVYTYTFADGLSGEFKITNGTWIYNFGASGDTKAVIGDNDAVFNGQDWSIEATTLPVTLTFTLIEGSGEYGSSINSKLNISISNQTGIEDVVIDNEADTEYYNLQGVRVLNPENGVFIARKAGKVFKTVIK